jgi:hypothetical protein
MITEVTMVRTITAAISLGIGTPRILRNSIQGT